MTNPDRNISFLSAKDALAIFNLSAANLTRENIKTAKQQPNITLTTTQQGWK